MPLIRPPYCGRCGLPYQRTVAAGVCGPCREGRRRRFRRARAVGRYEEGLKETVRSLKFGGRPRLASALGRLAFTSWIRTGELDVGDAVVPVPLHWRRRRERGFNQAELLGKAIAKAADKPCCRALVKVAPRAAAGRLERGSAAPKRGGGLPRPSSCSFRRQATAPGGRCLHHRCHRGGVCADASSCWGAIRRRSDGRPGSLKAPRLSPSGAPGSREPREPRGPWGPWGNDSPVLIDPANRI